jgi:hypothetical protein
VTDTQSESESIVREVWIAATPEDVFPYFTDAAKLIVDVAAMMRQFGVGA